MKLDKSLDNWVANGLISAEQSIKIKAFEKEHASASWVLFGIAGLGVVVLLTGIISVIAANWDDISAVMKLVVYFISLTILGWFTYKRSQVQGVLREILYTSFSFYILAGIGLIGQTYNLESDGYSALFMWLTITLPIALTVQSRIVCHAWYLILAIALMIWASSAVGDISFAFRAAILISTPYIILAIGYGFAHRLSQFFCTAGRIWSYAVLLIPFAIAGNIAWAIGGAPQELINHVSLYIHIPILSAVVSMIAISVRKIQPGNFITYLICGTIFATLLLIIPPVVTKLGGHQIIGCGLFILAWAGAAAIAVAFDRKRLFDFAALVIGIRFIVVYFEVFGSLAATGIGLIISGLVILAIAYLWHSSRAKVARIIEERI